MGQALGRQHHRHDQRQRDQSGRRQRLSLLSFLRFLRAGDNVNKLGRLFKNYYVFY